MKYMIDLTPPDGFNVKGIGIPCPGDWYADLGDITEKGLINGPINYVDDYGTWSKLKVILEKKTIKKEIIIFESTGEFREPREMEYFKISDGYNAIGYKPNHNVILGNKEIFKRISNYTYED